MFAVSSEGTKVKGIPPPLWPVVRRRGREEQLTSHPMFRFDSGVGFWVFRRDGAAVLTSCFSARIGTPRRTKDSRGGATRRHFSPAAVASKSPARASSVGVKLDAGVWVCWIWIKVRCFSACRLTKLFGVASRGEETSLAFAGRCYIAHWA